MSNERGVKMKKLGKKQAPKTNTIEACSCNGVPCYCYCLGYGSEYGANKGVSNSGNGVT